MGRRGERSAVLRRDRVKLVLRRWPLIWWLRSKRANRPELSIRIGWTRPGALAPRFARPLTCVAVRSRALVACPRADLRSGVATRLVSCCGGTRLCSRPPPVLLGMTRLAVLRVRHRHARGAVQKNHDHITTRAFLSVRAWSGCCGPLLASSGDRLARRGRPPLSGGALSLRALCRCGSACLLAGNRGGVRYGGAACGSVGVVFGPAAGGFGQPRIERHGGRSRQSEVVQSLA